MPNNETTTTIAQLSDRELQEWIYKFSYRSERHLNTIKNIMIAYIILGLLGASIAFLVTISWQS